ncbi:MAG: hypothetical protein Q8P67_05895 [archaeon]|nr:hypothetical protein [archaeon]
MSEEGAFPDSNFAAEVRMERRNLHEGQLRRGFLADFMVDPRHRSGVRRNTEVAQSRVIFIALLAFFVISGFFFFCFNRGLDREILSGEISKRGVDLSKGIIG